MKKENLDRPKIIVFTELLHQYRDPNHKKIKAYLKKNASDETFTQRAETLIKLWAIKDMLK